METRDRYPPPKPSPRVDNPPIEPGARLSAIVERLRGGGLVEAGVLAAELDMAPRTIYRDIGTLRALGVPVDGTRGAGYRLRDAGLTPPLAFTFAEIEALETGARIVQAWDGGRLGAAAEDALVKIEGVLPCARLQRAAGKGARKGSPTMPVFAEPGTDMTADERSRHVVLRRAIRARRRVGFTHLRADRTEASARVEPLSLVFWKGLWHLFAWSETAVDFASYETARMIELRIGARFPIVAGRRLDDFLRTMHRRG